MLSRKDYLQGIAAIYLLLGRSCNMSCRHCSQIPVKNTFSLTPDTELSEDVISFLKEWTSSKEDGESSKIFFWGGEPLLYWETIKRHILRFESEGMTTLTYEIYSNGLLLTEEIADFCNAHNVQFTLSYDAPNPTAVRNNVPSQENIKWFLKIEKRRVNFVFNALNCDPVSGFNMLEELFPETPITMGIINIFSEIPEDIYSFEEGQIENALDALAAEVVAGHDPYGNRYRFFIDKFGYLDTFERDDFINEPFPPCSPATISLSFKFNGDIVLCHNDSRVVANVNDNCEDIINAHLDYWKDFLPQKCLSCDVLPICRNRCPIGLFKTDESEYVHCDILRRIYGSVIRNYKKLTESDIPEWRDLRTETLV